LVKANGTPRAAFSVAALFPVYSIPLGGVGAVNMLLELPFVIGAFAAALAAVREQAQPRDRLSSSFLAGLAIGAAGMVRQPAIFEAAAVFGVSSVSMARSGFGWSRFMSPGLRCPARHSPSTSSPSAISTRCSRQSSGWL
jgi:hypothetical protein